MDRLKMAEMMVALYQLYPGYHMCATNDRTIVFYADLDGIITASEAIQLMAYAGEGSYAATA